MSQPNRIYEPVHDGQFIVSDLGRLSYETGLVDASVDLLPGTVLKVVAGVYEPMATGDTADEVAGILRGYVGGKGAGATRKVSILARLGEVTDENGRLTYPAGGADAAHVAADKAECLKGLAARFIILR